MLAAERLTPGPFHKSLDGSPVHLTLKAFLTLLSRHNDDADKALRLGWVTTVSVAQVFLPSKDISWRVEHFF